RTGTINTGSEYIVLPPDDARDFYSKISDAVDHGNGFYSLISENVCVGAVIYGNTGSDTKWIIGSAFLKSVYTIFDPANRQVGFAEIAHNN
ncbi:43406_t:CDS:2, partial [Gigaspora margarita]